MSKTLLAIIGLKDNATKLDMITAKLKVTAVSAYNTPAKPSIKIKGINTATRTKVVAIIAKDTCRDPLYAATNEPMGTSYRSRHVKPEYIFAGKTGTSQIRKITEEERKLKLKNKDLPYEKRDHALFIAFAPYKNPRYSISVVIEHGGSGSSGAAPIAKKVIKKVLERHKLRKKYQLDLYQEA